MPERDLLDLTVCRRADQAWHELQWVLSLPAGHRPRRAIMSLPLDHPHIKHWQVATTMRYVSPSATFVEDAYRRAVSGTLGKLAEEDHGR